MSPSSAARWRTPGSRGITMPDAASRRGLHRRRSRRRRADPRRLRPARLQGLRAAGAGERQGASGRRTRRHVRRGDARRGGGHRGLGRGSTSRSCPPSTTCWRRAGRTRRSFMSIGATTSSSKPSSTSAFEAALDAPIRVTREISTARQCMAPLEGRGVVAAFDHRLDQLALYTAHPDAAHRAQRPRRLPRPAAGAPSASSRPMSAAASATRASCCPRRSASPGWRCAAATRCAGSRTAAST